MALLNWTRVPRLTRMLSSSSSQQTRKMITRSGSVIRSKMWAC